MGLSSALLLGAVAAGLTASASIARGRWRNGLLFGAAVFIAAYLLIDQFIPMGFFGQAHAVYLGLTVTVPMVGLTMGLRLWKRHRRVSLAILGFAAALVGVGVYSTHIEPFWLRIDRQTIALPQLTEPLRLVVVSDIQNSSVGDWEREVVAAIAAEEPDVVLMPGDLWQLPDEEWPRRIPEFAQLVTELVEQVPALVMVDGDADWPGGYDILAARAGPRATFLHDDAVVTTIDGQRLLIAGAARFPEFDSRRAAMMRAVAEAPDDVVKIVLAHRPGIVYELDQAQPDLVVAGHTHGGQVSVPFFGPPVTLTSVPRAVGAGGLHIVDGVQLYVSTGAGVERSQAPQIRFGVRPSIGVLDLVPAG